MDCSTPGLPIHHQLLELAQTHVHRCMASVMPSNHLILCHPLLLPSIFPSIMVFSNESILRIRWPKYWSFSFSISPSNEYSGLISFRIDWFDLLAVQETLRSLLYTTVQKHQFFGAQLSLWSNSDIHTWLLEKPQLWLDGPLLDLCLKLSNSSKIGICTGSHHQLQPLIIFLYHSSVPDHSINSLALSFLYSATLISIHDHWENHSLD